MAWQPIRKSQWLVNYLFIGGLLIESEIEIENCLLKILGQIHLLPEFRLWCYLYSLTMTVYLFLTAMMSVYPFDYSFFDKGRFRIATKILGSSIFKLYIIEDSFTQMLSIR